MHKATGQNAIDDWLSEAQNKLEAWRPSPLSETLRTDIRDTYQHLIEQPETSLSLLRNRLTEATQREANPYHIQNIEAPGGCWELGTQIAPSRETLTTPSGKKHHLFTYRLVYVLTRALVLNPEDHIRHLCNNRACIRPDHLEVGSDQQNRQDEERRIYAGNSPQGRGQALHGHVPKHLQHRPDPFVPEPLEREK